MDPASLDRENTEAEKHAYETVEKPASKRPLENVQMQGLRNPEE